MKIVQIGFKLLSSLAVATTSVLVFFLEKVLKIFHAVLVVVDHDPLFFYLRIIETVTDVINSIGVIKESTELRVDA